MSGNIKDNGNERTTRLRDKLDSLTLFESDEYFEGTNAVVESFMSAVDDDGETSEANEQTTTSRLSGVDEDILDSEDAENRKEGKLAIAHFLQNYKCFDILPESSKVVVFDRNVPIRLSYYALVEHEIGAAPLWDPLSQDICGIVTTLDFIEILRYGHHTDAIPDILDCHSLASWRSLVVQLCESPEQEQELINSGVPAVAAAAMASKFEMARKISQYTNPDLQALYVHPDESLYESCKKLKDNCAHWIPIVDRESQVCLGVLTHLTVLQYLVSEFCEDRKIFDQPIRSLNIGTFVDDSNKLVTATLKHKVFEILDMMAINRISCVPILNGNGVPIAVYSRTNVIDLVSNNSVENSLHLRLGNLIFGDDFDAGMDPSREDMPDRLQVHACSVASTLQEVFVRFAEVRVHRLLYIDEEDGSLKGIVSLSDLLSYFLD